VTDPSARSTAEPLEFREVTKRYQGSAEPAVDGLSLEVPAGEICVLVGPSGCGKTTAMRMVNRMIDITSGDILLGGRSVRERRPEELRRHIGYVIQQIGLFPHRTIGENIATVPKLLGWDRRRVAARVDELLELVGLDPDAMRDRYPAQISGGQRQRVGVARALAVDPPVMLMDEPFGAIDPINRERLQNEFLRLQAELRKTIIFVTHDIDEAIKMGDRIAVMRLGGKLAQYAPPAELLMSPASAFVEDFVGADRALKRLALQRVRDIDLWTVAACRVGEPTAAVRARLEEADVATPLLVDDERRPIGWLGEDALRGEHVGEELRSRADPIVELDDILRDALSDLLAGGALYGPVVDAQGRVAGVLSIQVISSAIGGAPAGVPGATELAASEAREVGEAAGDAELDAEPAGGDRPRRRLRPGPHRSVGLRRRRRLLPAMDLGQRRPLPQPHLGAPVPHDHLRRRRLRARRRPRPARPPPALGRRTDRLGDECDLHHSEPVAVPAAAAADRPR
jgi:osmoprotectant transport system ATP-binding protein